MTLDPNAPAAAKAPANSVTYMRTGGVVGASFGVTQTLYYFLKWVIVFLPPEKQPSLETLFFLSNGAATAMAAIVAFKVRGWLGVQAIFQGNQDNQDSNPR